jgi:hypothetical protein
LRLGSGGTDYEEVRERRNLAQVEDYDLFRFLVCGQLGATFG